MKKFLLSLIIFPIVLILLTPSVAVAAADQPLPLPVTFYGTVLQGTLPAPAGTTIEARGEGVVSGPGNPFIVTQPGIYGSADPLSDVPRFFVQGNIPDGTEITFYVNGVLANETSDFNAGTGKELNLTTSAVTPPVGGGGGGGGGGGAVSSGTKIATVYGLQTDTQIELNDVGQVQNDVALTDTDKTFSLNIPRLTTITLAGVASTTLTAEPVDITTLPPAPDLSIVLAQDFGPDGTIFSPEATLTMTYDPNMIPAGVDPENLTIAYWDTATAKWVKLAGTVDTVTHSITVLIQHFTIYAIIGDISESPIIPTTPNNTESVAPTTPVTTTVVPATTTTPEPVAPTTSASAPIVPAVPTPAPTSMNWIWFAVAGIGVLLIVSIYFMKRRSRE